MSEHLSVPLEQIGGCFDGVVPSLIATVASDGTPNVTYLSVVHRVDADHVALSRQFFNKTDENTVRNPFAQVTLIEPSTGRQFKLDLVYERTETEGALFERMRTALDAVAAFEGMANVFRLKGTDVCRVTRSEMLPSEFTEGPAPRPVKLDRLQEFTNRLAASDDLEDVLQSALSALVELFGYPHAFIMLVDETGQRLFTVASAGYAVSGAGSEIRIGEGMIGVAAARRQVVRVTNMARELRYAQAAREAALRVTGAESVDERIPLPQLPRIQSQLITPMLGHRELIGMICLQSDHPGAFQSADECVAGILANQLAMAIAALRKAEPDAAPQPARKAVQVKHFAEDDSVFLDNEYLIKGVAGAILWRLLRAYEDERRSEFSNKELRLDPSLDLPDIKDNLEARLILLKKRLEERCDYLRIVKVARGRFRLEMTRPLTLLQA